MWRHKLLPLSWALRRATPRFASIHSISHLLCYSALPSQQVQTLESSRVYGPLTRRPIVQPNIIFSAAKNFSSRTAGDQFRCWNCNAAADGTASFLVCESCRSIQPVNQSVDYFNIFGLDKKYEIEVGNLEGKYKDWQKKLHPDLVHTKSEREREYAAEQSARVTDAYRTLIDPLSRAIYILRLAGVDVNEEETVLDPELLTEIMEIREAVEEAGDSQVLNQIQIQVQQELDNWSKCFTNAFQCQKYEEAINSIQRMTYYKRANEEIVKRL